MLAMRPLFALVASLALFACGGDTESSTPPVGAGLAESSLSGLYEVAGLTTEMGSGAEREIAGTIIISQEGDRYASTFSLKTMFPTPSGALPTEVIGKGEGTIVGNDCLGVIDCMAGRTLCLVRAAIDLSQPSVTRGPRGPARINPSETARYQRC